MLAGHFAFTFGADEAWIVLVLDHGPDGQVVRHFFNLWHTGRRAWWILGAAAVGCRSRSRSGCSPTRSRRRTAGAGAVRAGAGSDRRAAAAEPATRDASAPLGVRLETEAEITARAEDIERQAVQTRAMPPGTRPA